MRSLEFIVYSLGLRVGFFTAVVGEKHQPWHLTTMWLIRNTSHGIKLYTLHSTLYTLHFILFYLIRWKYFAVPMLINTTPARITSIGWTSFLSSSNAFLQKRKTPPAQNNVPIPQIIQGEFIFLNLNDSRFIIAVFHQPLQHFIPLVSLYDDLHILCWPTCSAKCFHLIK